MKKNRNIKKLIKKRILIKNGKKSIIKSNNQTPKPINPKPISTSTIKPKKTVKIIDKNAKERKEKIPEGLTKHQQRDFRRTGNIGLPTTNHYVTNKKFIVPYIKEKDVKYDVIILISSFNRYEKVQSLIEQLTTQETKYNYKVVLLNDGSTDWRYDKLKSEFSDIVYIKNKVNGGKTRYWRSINSLFSFCKVNKSHIILQIDDDYILCENYLDIICDKFFELKELDNRYVAISYHRTHSVVPSQWGMKHWVDGGTLFDNNFINEIDFKIDEISKSRWRRDKEISSGVWNQVSRKIESMRLYVHKMEYSLVKHNGNEDSKMNKSQRDKSPITTWRFLDDINIIK